MDNGSLHRRTVSREETWKIYIACSLIFTSLYNIKHARATNCLPFDFEQNLMLRSIIKSFKGIYDLIEFLYKKMKFYIVYHISELYWSS